MISENNKKKKDGNNGAGAEIQNIESSAEQKINLPGVDEIKPTISTNNKEPTDRKVLDRKGYRQLTDEEYKLLESVYSLCHFEGLIGSRDDCNCGFCKSIQVWWESTSYEYELEGEYWCSICGLKEIKEKIEWAENIIDEYEKVKP